MKLIKTLSIFPFAFSVSLVVTSAQGAKVKWKMHSVWGSQITHLGGRRLPQALCIFHLTFAACALVPTSATENANAQIARVLLIFINAPPVLFNA